MVSPSYAITDKKAMMVEVLNTIVTKLTMTGFWRFLQFTCFTIPKTTYFTYNNHAHI